MIRVLAALAACIALTACAAVPNDIAFDASAEEALVVIEAAGPASVGGLYALQVTPFDPARGFPTAGYISMDEVNDAATQRRFFIGRAKPGRYVISSVSHQGVWYACFNGGTHQFDIRPGAVNYLGRVDPRPALVELALKTPSMSMNSQHYYVLDTPRLPLQNAADVEGGRTAVGDFLARSYPGVKADLVDIQTEPATFQTGRSLFGEKVCYGYFRKDGRKG